MNEQGYTKIDWDNQFKIKPRRNASKTHEVLKLLYTLLKIEKHKQNLYWLRIYTEYPITNQLGKTKICDIYIENIKTNECFAIEIQNNVSDKWLEETKNFYNSWKKMFFTTDWILIKEKDFNNLDNILEEVVSKLKEYIV